jgi:hypothetical protein
MITIRLVELSRQLLLYKGHSNTKNNADDVALFIKEKKLYAKKYKKELV